MKKILVMMMTIVMAISMTACTEAEKEAYDLYVDMNKAMEGVTSVEADMEAVIAMEAEGETIDMTMSATVKELILSETDVQMEMLMDMTMMGQSISSTSYFKNGYMYQDVAGQKYKTEMDLEEAMGMANAMDSMQFDKEAVLTSEVTTDGDNKTLSFTLAGDKVTEIMDAMIGSTFSSMGLGDVEMTMGDMTYSTVIDKDNMALSCDMAFVMTMTAQGETIVVDYQVTQNMTAYNTITEINFPADLDSYTAA